MFAWGSHHYARDYKSSKDLWTYAVNEFPGAWPGHNDLGNAFLDANRLAEAEVQYKEALALNPGYPEAHNNLGIVFARTGRIPEAIEQFQLALKYCPDLASAQDNLNRMLAAQARPRK